MAEALPSSLSSDGSITIGGKLDGSSRLSLTASGDIHLEGKVDNNSIADMAVTKARS